MSEDGSSDAAIAMAAADGHGCSIASAAATAAGVGCALSVDLRFCGRFPRLCLLVITLEICFENPIPLDWWEPISWPGEYLNDGVT